MSKDVKARVRRTLTITLQAAVTAAIITALIVCGFSRCQRGEEVTVNHVVSEGETLWSIADEYGVPAAEKPRWIYNVRRANGDMSADLHIGQVITITTVIE